MSKIKPSNGKSVAHTDSKFEQIKLEVIETKPASSIAAISDPHVKATRPYTAKRTFSRSYKDRMLAEYNACGDATARGAFLRKEGIYHAQIGAWRSQQAARGMNGGKSKLNGKSATRMEHLARENEQLKKRLMQAEAIIDLQKKVSELLGMHILPHEKSGTNS